jgi:hypothetical protein
MIIGGIAVIARGVRRMTTDIDAVVRGDAVDARKLLRVLARHGVEPRIEGAEAFAEKNLVLLLRHRPTGVDLDVSLGWTDFEREAIQASTAASYGRASYPMARAEDLVVFKALAARPKDIEDAAALILMHPTIDLVRVRRRLADLAALAEEPALVEGLERAHQAWAPPPRGPLTRTRSFTVQRAVSWWRWADSGEGGCTNCARKSRWHAPC